jgi:uncharacterized membrane protein YphA (DoxX/SURF4 family)
MVSFISVPRAATLVLRIALGAVFVYAAWTKLRVPWELFAMEVDSYQLLPLKAVEFVARTLPWFELVVGLLLIAGFWLRTASLAITLLLAGFFTLMVRAYAKGMEIPCGCFGANDIISWKTLLRDGSLLAAATALTVLSFRFRTRPKEQPGASLQDV